MRRCALLFIPVPIVGLTQPRSSEEELVYILHHIFFEPRFGHDLLTELTYKPADILLVDRLLYPTIAAAESTGLPTVILWHTLFGVLLSGIWAERFESSLDTLNAMRREFGVAPVETQLALVKRLQLVLVFVPEFFDVALPDMSSTVHYVGSLLPPVSEESRKPAIAAVQDTRPLVVVSFSTVYQDQMAPLQRVLDATADLPIRVFLTVGRGLDPASLTPPPNAVVERFVPHEEVLPQAVLLVTHAGLVERFVNP